MKKSISFLMVLVFLISSSACNVALAAKKKAKGNSGSALVLKSRDGSNILYGSVLNSKANEVTVKLPKKVLAEIRSAGLDNISISITKLTDQAGDETNIYTLDSSEAASLFG